MPRVSVIVPIYNTEKYLHRCIESILRQSFEDFELILVDDGSTDNCGDICDKYAKADNRVQVLHCKNGGVSRARNNGLDIAKGRYVTFCDSDDWWDSDLLEKTIPLMECNDWDWISFQYRGVWTNGKAAVQNYQTGLRELYKWEDIIQFLLKDFLQYKYGWEIWARIFRSDIIRQNHIRFCESCGNYAEDMGFCVKYILCAKSFLAIDECLYNYFHRDGSMMANSVNVVKLNELNEVSYDVCAFAKEHMPETIYRNAVGVLHYQILHNQISCLFYKKEFRDFKKYIKEVERRDWFYKGVIATIKNRHIIESLYGKQNARLMMNLSLYCMHKNWFVYAGIKRLCKIKGE